MDELHENAKDSRTILADRAAARCSSAPPLVCLNFKVPLRVRQQFKMYAARHNMTMTELLLRALDDLLISEGNGAEATRPPHKR